MYMLPAQLPAHPVSTAPHAASVRIPPVLLPSPSAPRSAGTRTHSIAEQPPGTRQEQQNQQRPPPHERSFSMSSSQDSVPMDPTEDGLGATTHRIHNDKDKEKDRGASEETVLGSHIRQECGQNTVTGISDRCVLAHIAEPELLTSEQRMALDLIVTKFGKEQRQAVLVVGSSQTGKSTLACYVYQNLQLLFPEISDGRDACHFISPRLHQSQVLGFGVWCSTPAEFLELSASSVTSLSHSARADSSSRGGGSAAAPGDMDSMSGDIKSRRQSFVSNLRPLRMEDGRDAIGEAKSICELNPKLRDRLASARLLIIDDVHWMNHTEMSMFENIVRQIIEVSSSSSITRGRAFGGLRVLAFSDVYSSPCQATTSWIQEPIIVNAFGGQTIQLRERIAAAPAAVLIREDGPDPLASIPERIRVEDRERRQAVFGARTKLFSALHHIHSISDKERKMAKEKLLVSTLEKGVGGIRWLHNAQELEELICDEIGVVRVSSSPEDTVVETKKMFKTIPAEETRVFEGGWMPTIDTTQGCTKQYVESRKKSLDFRQQIYKRIQPQQLQLAPGMLVMFTCSRWKQTNAHVVDAETTEISESVHQYGDVAIIKRFGVPDVRAPKEPPDIIVSYIEWSVAESRWIQSAEEHPVRPIRTSLRSPINAHDDYADVWTWPITPCNVRHIMHIQYIRAPVMVFDCTSVTMLTEGTMLFSSSSADSEVDTHAASGSGSGSGTGGGRVPTVKFGAGMLRLALEAMHPQTKVYIIAKNADELLRNLSAPVALFSSVSGGDTGYRVRRS